jgi:hypothetical protein
MLDFEDVVLQTTKGVIRKTTFTGRPAAEYDRRHAWQHLRTVQQQNPDEWAGELAKSNGLAHRSSGLLGEIAEKYDTALRRVELDALDEVEETDLLAALLVGRVLRDKLLHDEGRLLGAARRRGITWARLAAALEMRNRQSAERRYLQLRTDLDEVSGEPLTQSERAEFARSQRDRRTERQWAMQQGGEVVALAQRLVAVPDLQQRADRSTHAGRAAARAAQARPGPAAEPVPVPWPAQLAEIVAVQEAHVAAGESSPARLSPVEAANAVHRLFGLIGYALDPQHADLSDHPDLVADIHQLYAAAGPAAPRAPEDYGRPERSGGAERREPSASAPTSSGRRSGAGSAADLDGDLDGRSADDRRAEGCHGPDELEVPGQDQQHHGEGDEQRRHSASRLLPGRMRPVTGAEAGPRAPLRHGRKRS